MNFQSILIFFFMKHKDQAFQMFKNYKLEVENQKGKKIKILRSNKGGEYFSMGFSLVCEENEIIHQTSAPYTPQQNDLVERKNKTLLICLTLC